jgi:sialidase-1
MTMNDTYAYSRMLYSGPNYHSRGHYVVRMSYDESQTWPVEKEVYSGPAAYGQLAVLANKTVCLLFEAGKYDYRDGIYFTRFVVIWLSDGADH